MKLNLVYKIVNGSAPEYLQNDFNHVSQTHRYSTRQSVSSLCIPSVKSAGPTPQLSYGMKCLRKLRI